MNISISSQHAQFIETAVESGRYADNCALINEAIELLKRRDELIRAVEAGVKALDRGETVDGDKAPDRLAEKYRRWRLF